MPTSITGKVEIVAIRDLGKLGDRESKPVLYEIPAPGILESWFK